MYDFYSDRTIFSSRSRPYPRKSLRIVRRFGRRFLPARFCTGRTGSGSSFPVPPASPRQPTECRTFARRIFLSAGFCTSPLPMHRLLHAVCTRLYLRTDTGASRLIFPVSPVFAIEHNRGPPCRKFPLTQTRHTRLRPYFDKPDGNGPPGRGSFLSPTGRYPPTAKISLPFILPKRSANRHVSSPTVTGTRGGKEPQPSFIVNSPAHPYPIPPPCTQRKRPGNLRRSPLLYTSHGETGTIRSSVVIPPPSSATAQKSRIPAAQKIFSTASRPVPAFPYSSGIRSNPRLARPTVRMSNEDRDGQNGPLPASSSHDGRTKPGRQTKARTFRPSVKTDRHASTHKIFYLAPPACHGNLPCTLPCRPPSGRQDASPILYKTQNSSFRPKHFPAGKKTDPAKTENGTYEKPTTKNRGRDRPRNIRSKTSSSPRTEPAFSEKSPLPLSRNATPSERCLFMRYNRCPTSEALRIKRY